MGFSRLFFRSLTVGDDATLSVVRHPSGMMPCYVRRTPDGAILASDMPALAERGQVDVDHGALARTFAGIDTTGRRKGIRGIEELLPGERILVTPNGTRIDQTWSHWDPVCPAVKSVF